MVRCDACDARWPLEDTKHHSPCGAVFVGGEVWEGMAIELTRIAHVEWIRRLGITRGELRPRVVDWWNRYQHCAVRRDQHGRDCECALPKLCLDDDCRCGRRKGCTDHADHRCDRLAVCASPRCTCTRPKVKV